MRRALIIEDLPDSQDWLRALLEEAFPGIEVTTADSVGAARTVLRSGYDLALVDLGLPDGSGVDLIAELTRVCPQAVRVVATIFDDDRHLMAALEAGAQGYILKQQPRRQLVGLLKGIVDGQPPLSPAIARRILASFQRPPQEEPADLTGREREVLSLIARGYRIAETADLMHLSPHTVHGYIKAIYQKLNISSRAEATLEAARRGLVEP